MNTPTPNLPESVVTDADVLRVLHAAQPGFVTHSCSDFLLVQAVLEVVASDLRAANARAEGLEQDAARLDWLDAQRNDDVQVEHDGERSLIACYWNVGGQCYDVRTAIDHEMECAAQAVRSEGSEGES